eukprot:TRINITY_DN3255_c1_g1_i1.p1 TRINITY_DN3255_c1_g1~~TRINITY_DN3255_c1_g1_i1.p1  ORF type:complete len:3803 (+),score=1118.83 TRINITY_DN3255_c1_g1_i1:106-11514(+)
MIDHRITVDLNYLRTTLFFEIPQKPFEVDEFSDFVRENLKNQAHMIEQKNRTIENSVNDIIEIFSNANAISKSPQFASLCEKFFDDYCERTFGAILESLCLTLNYFKDTLKDSDSVLFDCELLLENEQLSLNPTVSNQINAVFELIKKTVHSTIFISNWKTDQSLIEGLKEKLQSYDDDENENENAFENILESKTDDSMQSMQDLLKRIREMSPFPRICNTLSFFKLLLATHSTINDLELNFKLFFKQFDRFVELWSVSPQDKINQVKKDKEINELNYEHYCSLIYECNQMIDDITHMADIQHINKELIKFDLRLFKEQLLFLINMRKKFFLDFIFESSYKGIGELRERLINSSDQLTDFLKTSNENTSDIDLEKLKNVMELIQDLRILESEYEFRLIPLNEAFDTLLNQCNFPRFDEIPVKVGFLSAIEHIFDKNIAVSKSDIADDFENLNHLFVALRKNIRYVTMFLTSNQKNMKRTLISSVAQLTIDVNEYLENYQKNGPMVADISPETAMERLKTFKTMYQDKERRCATFNVGEVLFNLPTTEYPKLNTVKKQLRLLDNLYSLHTEVMVTIDGYSEILWQNKDLDEIAYQLSDFQQKNRKLPSDMRTWPAYIQLKEKIDSFYDTLPLLQALGHPAMRKRHWDAIEKLYDATIQWQSEDLKLGDLLAIPLLTKKDDLEDICNAAVKEAEIEEKLAFNREQWKDQIFIFQNYKNRGLLMLQPSQTTELVANLEDSQLTLSSLIASRYKEPFAEEITKLLHQLSTCSERIDQWLSVQFLWAYLEAVFSSGDIVNQLPKEAKIFASIDKSWVKIMTIAVQEPNVISLCCSNDTLKDLLPHLIEQLELCQKSLNHYLEKKRDLFPRFFFVFDTQLLEILGQASDPNNIQSHLKSITEGVNKVVFNKNRPNEIVGIESIEEEKCPISPVLATGNIETWLINLLNSISDSLRGISRMAAFEIQEALQAGENINLRQFIVKYPAQVVLLGLQILWTSQVEDGLKKSRNNQNAMQATTKKVNKIMKDLIQLTTEDLPTARDRQNVETLVTIQVHQRDICDDLYRRRVRSAYDFDWLKQSRYYWRLDRDTCIISITDVDFEYGYEYLGAGSRLVITPLTDRCYITLAQALGMFLGGAPAGPAGTGKTETVKDMAKSLGKYICVFNGSPEMSVTGLGKIFKGLAMSGAWGDFDEFNRILLPVISVVAQQIACVLNAMRTMQSQFTFTDGSVIPLNPTCGFFITMNPGYAGRTELPENLKVLFRSVAMIVPDSRVIMRVKFAASGFLDNEVLSKKFDLLYSLCKQQLSAQRHYDFGLRNILSVLRTCGNFRRINREAGETDIFLRVVRDMNLSKLVGEDADLFVSLLNDLFPGKKVEEQHYHDLESAMATYAEEHGLVMHPRWVTKMVQLFESQNVRHGNFILGSTGTGKTQCIETLYHAMSVVESRTLKRQYQPNTFRMNPKSFTAQQMFGVLNAKTGDWRDGIFSVIWRKIAKKLAGEYVWLVLDGPVDTLWIESLNTVLDDNKTLTLANGDRIAMSPTMRLMFEVHSLENASPATVSRCGMVYIDHIDLGWEPILESWLNSSTHLAEKKVMNSLSALINDNIPHILQYLKVELSPVMKVYEPQYVTQLLNLLGYFLPAFKKHLENNDYVSILERIFVVSLTWSIGALLEKEDRAKFGAHLRTLNLNLPNVEKDETIFDYWISDRSGHWISWEDQVPLYTFPMDTTPDFNDILVPTVDSIRTEKLIDICVSQQNPILLIGEPGTAKSVTMKNYIKAGIKADETFDSKTLNFSFFTTPEILQRTIESTLEKRLGTQYGPKGGKKLFLFLDDLNMPSINEWGDQTTNELVRQIVEEKSFYNLDKPGEKKQIIDTLYMGAMQQPGGGRNDIPERLKRHFNIFNITLPTNRSIYKIYNTMICGFFTNSGIRGFTDVVANSASQIFDIIFNIWQSVRTRMLPTPSKFHYVFNLRDLSRVVQGMMKADNRVVTNVFELFALVKHECERVFPDRFINYQDIETYGRIVNDVFSNKIENQNIVGMLSKPINFASFLEEEPEPTGDEEQDKLLESWTPGYLLSDDMQFVRHRLEELMVQHNEMSRKYKLELVLFNDAVQHLVRLTRLLKMPGGHMLLVGVGGSGKQSLTKLASFIVGNVVKQIQISKKYNRQNLLEDLQTFFKIAGLENKGVTFLFTDKEILEESFLEFINNILTTGEIPGLFPRDEMDSIIGELASVYRREFPRSPVSNDDVWNFFMNRIKKNFHVVLCFSPIGETFRLRALKFPGLISGCQVDWFHPWPEQALKEVAQRFIGDFEIDCDQEIKEELIGHMAKLHSSMTDICDQYFQQFRRPVYVTPKSYLSFLQLYKDTYSQKYQEIGALSNRLTTGLDKLNAAGKQVELMSVELKEKNKELAVSKAQTDKMLADVTKQTADAQKVTAQVQSIKDKVAAEAAVIAKEKAEAEEELAAAEPALRSAEAALDQISSGDIAAVKRLLSPPNLIKRIMDAVLILCNRPLVKWQIDPEMREKGQILPKASYDEAIKMMSDTGFLNMLKNFPKEEITDETCELLLPYLEMEDFTVEAASRSSGSMSGLCAWSRAMVEYHVIAKQVDPKIKKLREAEVNMRIASERLAEVEANLAEKQAILDAITAKYEEAVASKKKLEDEAALIQRRMDSATKLIQGLAGERTRWSEQAKEFHQILKSLVGDIALASAFLSYAGPFNTQFRNLLIAHHWRKDLAVRSIPYSNNFNFKTFLTTETQIGEWFIQGLPSDDLSVQNGLITTTTSRYPLMVDPQGQARTWLINKESENNLKITKFSDKHFRHTLEECLSFGYPLLIEDIGSSVDPVLDSILDKQFIKVGNSLKVRVGDKEVDVMKGFYLYMTTSLANPNYSPEIFAKVSVINFTVTLKGLEDQLLTRVIMHEKSELEDKRKALMEEVNKNAKIIENLEKDLVVRLSATEGNLVDDIELIDMLAATKKTSMDVSKQLETSKTNEVKINEAREEFRSIATRGSIIYFLITEMSEVSNMYQTSLNQFLNRFDMSLDNAEQSKMTSQRIENVLKYLTSNLYAYICRGLFGNHKLLFALQLALKIDLEAEIITFSEFSVLIKGGASVDRRHLSDRPYQWLPDYAWLNIVALAQNVGAFSTLIADLGAHNETLWRAFYDMEDPENRLLTEIFGNRLSPFYQLLLVRSIRPDRAMLAAQNYIRDRLGNEFVEPPPLSLESINIESQPNSPIVSLLSLGADPSNDIISLARHSKINITSISMGQGQEVGARAALETCRQNGSWVLLQNCHLSLEFMIEIENEIGTWTEENTMSSFRLWITTEPHPDFPIGLLQQSLKIACEAPLGIKANLQRTFADMNQDTLDSLDKKAWKPMLFTLCFLHSVVQERRKFGPLGFNIPYEFNQSDLTASLTFLQNTLYQTDENKEIPFSTIRYMICEVHYGGRITDNFDRRLMNTYGVTMLNNKVLIPEYEFASGFSIPNMTHISKVREYLDHLPTNDSPEIFGMHQNADITYRTRQADAILDTILAIQPKDSSSSGETPESVGIKTQDRILKNLHADFEPIDVERCLKIRGRARPMIVFLRQEVERVQKLLSAIRSDLTNMKLAIEGIVVMSEHLSDILNSLYDARVPKTWTRLSWESPTLGDWLADVDSRCQQYRSWLDLPKDSKPSAFWLGGFYNPQGFLTAVKQEIARAHQGWALDTLHIVTTVKDYTIESVKNPPEEGVYVHGLFLEGCRWNAIDKKLDESSPKELLSELPVLHISASDQAPHTQSSYDCPVYFTQKRRNHIFNVQLPSSASANHWIIRGVALLLVPK